MSTNRDEEVIAAYAAGEDVEQMQRRFGVSGEQIRQIVATVTEDRAETGGVALSGAERRRRTPLATAGVVLIVLGLVGPCVAGTLWLAIYYLSETAYPVSSWGYGNLTVGLSGICAGSILAVTGLVLLLIARLKRR